MRQEMPRVEPKDPGGWDTLGKMITKGSRPSPPRRRWRWWLALSILLFPALVLGGGYYSLTRHLPPVEALMSYQPSLATRVYSDDNRLIGQFFIERRILVPLEEMPQELIQAVIAVEDSRFYAHGGFDLVGILRAAVANLSSMEIRQGGSTITQQLARSLFLTPERTYTRKLKEVMLARKIEKFFSKDQILEMYLNQIYYGHGAYGTQTAARTYFGKDVGDLKLPEAAFLAGLPKAPRNYSPFLFPQRAKERQGVVLKRMHFEGFITEAKYRQAFQQDLYFNKLATREATAAYFLETVRQHLISEYGEEKVYRGGMNVYTTLNIEMQKAAQEALQKQLRRIDKRQGFRGALGTQALGEIMADMPRGTGSLNVAEPAVGDLLHGVVTGIEEDHVRVSASRLTGTILLKDMKWAKRRLLSNDLDDVEILRNPAPGNLLNTGDVILVSRLPDDPGTREIRFALEQEPHVEAALLAADPRTGDIKAMVGGYDFKRSEFNRAILARRQPGSAFKPFIYGAVIEAGWSPATILMDAPLIYNDPRVEKVWKPTNYNERFYGPITLRDALTFSKNVATVRLLEDIGVQRVIRFARRLGIQSPLTSDLSLALGSSSVSLKELVMAYSTFANQGLRTQSMMIRMVTDSEGDILEYHEPDLQQVLSPEVAYIVTDLLKDVVHRGTGRRARNLGHAVAGKTGTTNDFTDAWFVGYLPNLVAGVWVGFDERRTLGDREAGSVAALPIWKEFMQKSMKLIPEESFVIPENVVYSWVFPESGLLAPAGDEDARIEIFVKGHEPHKGSPPRPSVIEFYRMDQQDLGGPL